MLQTYSVKKKRSPINYIPLSYVHKITLKIQHGLGIQQEKKLMMNKP